MKARADSTERRAPRRRRRRFLLLLGLVAFLFAVLSWSALRLWAPPHVQQVTGRDDAPPVGCLHCHGPERVPVRAVERQPDQYPTPTGLAVSSDGRMLFVAAAGIDQVLAIDAASGEIAGRAEVAGRPHGIAISPDGTRLAVTSRDHDKLHILAVDGLRRVRVLATGSEPLGVAFSADGTQLYIAESQSDQLRVLAADGDESRRLQAGNEPYAVAASGALVAVANRLARPVGPGQLPVSELTLVDPVGGRVIERRELVSGHLSEGVALAADGSFALATLIRVRNLLPLTQVARGAVMNSEIVFVDTSTGGRTVQLPLDRVSEYFADPADVVLTPAGDRAFVAHTGGRVVTAVDVDALRALVDETPVEQLGALADELGVSERYVLGRIATRENPQAMAMAPNGRRLYVAERLNDSIAVIDTHSLTVVDRFDLGGPAQRTAERRGEIVFTDASITFQGQFSCRSCHPDGHSDGLVWDFVSDGVGQNLVETRSLRGIKDTAPFKWNGKNPDLPTQCGPRFAMVLTRSDPFPADRLADLVSYIESIPTTSRPLPTSLAAASERGRQTFFRITSNSGELIPPAGRCSTCHRGPLYTDRLMSDVGTGGAFDVPHLLDIGNSAPYLHDGRSTTLTEIWTVHNPDDRHGVANDLTKSELNDLIVFLRSL